MPYYNYMNQQPYMSYGNPYYNPQVYQPQQPKNNQEQFNYKPDLQGKIVESIAVAKMMDIPLDGSTSFFPLADGSSIVSKQLQQDGKSKIVIYKPVNDEIDSQSQNYVTENDLNAKIKDLNSKDIKDIKEDIKVLKRKIEDITDDLKDKKEK